MLEAPEGAWRVFRSCCTCGRAVVCFLVKVLLPQCLVSLHCALLVCCGSFPTLNRNSLSPCCDPCALQHVRRAAVVALGTAAHNKAALMEDLLPQLLPLLYDQMRKKVGMAPVAAQDQAHGGS